MSKSKFDAPSVLRSNNLTAQILYQKIWRRANVANDWFCFAIVGREGSGKSYTSMSILEKVDPSFNGERVYFDPADFLEYIESLGTDERTGKAIMLDESGVGLGVRSWYEKGQVKFNQTMQTARDDNMVVCLTLPRLSELDSQMRGRLHAFLEMKDLHPGQYAKFKWKNVDPRRDEVSKLYKKLPRKRVPEFSQAAKVNKLSIGPPSEQLVTDYEVRKKQFKSEQYEDTVGELRDDIEEEDLGPKEVVEIIKNGYDIDNIVGEDGRNGDLIWDDELIQVEFDLSKRKSRQVKKLIRKDDSIELPE